MTFADLLRKVSRTRKFIRPDVLICFDPGETTGYAIFHDADLFEAGQLDTYNLQDQAKNIYGFIARHFEDRNLYPTFPANPQVVYEDYKVYGHKRNQHVGNELHTAKLIGIIEAACQMMDIPTHKQMAATAKPFCTDAKLKEWGFWQTAERHANDAIRHGAYYLLFGGKK